MNFELVNYDNKSNKEIIKKINNNTDINKIFIENNYELYNNEEFISQIKKEIISQNNNINLSDTDIILIIHSLLLLYIFFNIFNKSKI